MVKENIVAANYIEEASVTRSVRVYLIHRKKKKKGKMYIQKIYISIFLQKLQYIKIRMKEQIKENK